MSPSVTLVIPSPSASLTAVITCTTFESPGPTPLPGGCPAEERAALTAVADLGYAVATVDIRPYGWPCGTPFFSVPPGELPPGCPAATDGGPTAYVSFVGTDKVAALTFSLQQDKSLVAHIIAFQVPPSGPPAA